MGQFFIDRPVFAWVIALFIILAGALSITKLPVSQYPTIAPPTIVVTAVYPGATAQALEDSVTSLIEQEMNGADGLQYMESQSQANGQAQITLTFSTNTNPDLAAVDVQNRLKRVESRLPQAVTQQGVQVNKARSNFLLFITLSSEDNRLDPIALGDYLSRNVLNEIKRIPGVGQAQLFGSERAMRIWIDPARLMGYRLTPADVSSAIRAQNAQVASGTLGELPSPATQQIAATVVVNGQLSTPEQFGAIVLRANPDGSVVRLRDVARIELGGQAYATAARIDGKPISAIGVQLSPTANALGTATAVHAKMDELQKYFPPNVKYTVPYDTSKFVQISIEEVVKTLLEAIVLVFLVIYPVPAKHPLHADPDHRGAGGADGHLRHHVCARIFDQRADHVRPGAGDRHPGRRRHRGGRKRRTHHERGRAVAARRDHARRWARFPARWSASRWCWSRCSSRWRSSPARSAPIYRQFTLSMVASILFSILMAFSLTPALAATILKPIRQGEHHEKKGFYGWFNRSFNRTSGRLPGHGGARCCKKPGARCWSTAWSLLVVGLLYVRLPSSFLPSEDQGYIVTNIQLAPGASQSRALEVVKQVEDYYLKQPGVAACGRGHRLQLFRQRPECRHWPSSR